MFFILLSDAFKTFFMDFLFRYSHHHYYHQHYRILFAQIKAEPNRNTVDVFSLVRSRDRSEGVKFESVDSNLGFTAPKVIHPFLVNDSMIQLFCFFTKQSLTIYISALDI